MAQQKGYHPVATASTLASKESFTTPLNTRLQIRPALPSHPPQQLLRLASILEHRQIDSQILYIGARLDSSLRIQAMEELRDRLNIPGRGDGEDALASDVREDERCHVQEGGVLHVHCVGWEARDGVVVVDGF